MNLQIKLKVTNNNSQQRVIRRRHLRSCRCAKRTHHRLRHCHQKAQLSTLNSCCLVRNRIAISRIRWAAEEEVETIIPGNHSSSLLNPRNNNNNRNNNISSIESLLQLLHFGAFRVKRHRITTWRCLLQRLQQQQQPNSQSLESVFVTRHGTSRCRIWIRQRTTADEAFTVESTAKSDLLQPIWTVTAPVAAAVQSAAAYALIPAARAAVQMRNRTTARVRGICVGVVVCRQALRVNAPPLRITPVVRLVSNMKRPVLSR